jgi:hypothetical protein
MAKPLAATDVKKLTPILLVEAIEPSLPFWTALGFSKTIEVPEGDRLGFVALELGPVEVMLQSRASMRKDMATLGDQPFHSSTILYIEVAALDAVLPLLGSAPVVTPRRKTFYGADEIFVREPGGNVVGFTAHSA